MTAISAGLRDMSGSPISMQDGVLNVPHDPIVHYIVGDGIGADITPVMMDVNIRGTIIILSSLTKMVPKAVIKAYVLLWERSVPEY